MSYKFITPCCVRKLRVDNGLEGRKLECPFCTSLFYIPSSNKPKSKKKKFFLAIVTITSIGITASILHRNQEVSRQANQLHLIAAKEHIILIDAITLKMEESDLVQAALAHFKIGEQYFTEGNHKQAISNFETAIGQLTKAQILHSEIKAKVQPEITQLKKRLKKYKNNKRKLEHLQRIESYKNNLQVKEALKEISKLKSSLS